MTLSRSLLVLVLGACLSTPPANADPTVPTIGTCYAAASDSEGEEANASFCAYIPISTSATLWISGSAASKSAYVTCLTPGHNSPTISTGSVRYSQVPGDYCTLHVYVLSGEARATVDSRLPM